MSKYKSQSERLYDVIKKPLVTEKSHSVTALNKYTFEVVKDANKTEIKNAVEACFPGRKVKSVRTIYMPSHQKRVGKTIGRTQSSKKAIVTIEGEPLSELTGA